MLDFISLTKCLALAGLMLLVVPANVCAQENEVDVQQEKGTIPRLVRRNFLRFGKRDFQKRFSDNELGELMAEIYHHKSIPRSLLQQEKRSFNEALEPNYDEMPFDNDETDFHVMKRGGDNFLRFGKRGPSPKDQDIFLIKAFSNNAHLDKRSKDFLRFG